MKRIAFAALVFFALAMLSTAQATPPAGDSAPVHVKGVTLSGQLSSNGKVLRADDDNDWTITNLEAVKDLQGQYITVNCRMDPGKRAIRVLFVVHEPPTKHGANLGDSAFRR